MKLLNPDEGCAVGAGAAPLPLQPGAQGATPPRAGTDGWLPVEPVIGPPVLGPA
jgi:hypothetical protein